MTVWCAGLDETAEQSSGRPLTPEYRIDACRITRGAHIEHL